MALFIPIRRGVLVLIEKLPDAAPVAPLDRHQAEVIDPWDPLALDAGQLTILRCVAANPELCLSEIGQYFGLSPRDISILHCCELGQTELSRLEDCPAEVLRPYKLRPLWNR